MYRGGILFFVGLFLFPSFALADVEIFSSDFSTDPNWSTDQPANFFWDSASSSLSIHIDNRPPDPLYEPNRYFVKETELDPNKDWKLEWEMYLEGANRDGAYIFGLYSPDYIYSNRTHKNYPKIISESTINVALYTLSRRHNNFDYAIVDENGTNLGFGGGNGNGYFNVGVWYQASIEYNASSSTLHYIIVEKETGVFVADRIKQLPIGTSFSSDMRYLGVSMYPDGQPGTVFDDVRRINGSSDYVIDNVTLTQLEEVVEEPEPEPEQLSDLLLQYEPVLYFHPDEDYYPMNVEAFVEGSGLWEKGPLFGSDTNMIERGDGNALTLDYLATTTDTSSWYINFSSDEAGTFDVAEAKARYNALRESGKATSTYYAYEMRDSYTDELGKTHEFIVLQYWYFYALNNWGDYQLLGNNHEGDWESIFIYLDADTEEPLYAAFSAHHNDGDPSNPLQYDSVRREWSDVIFDDGPVSLVSAGSHANYPDNGVDGSRFAGRGNDLTSLSGIRTNDNFWRKKELLSTTTQNWNETFYGQWGSNMFGLGQAGPRGPQFSTVSGIVRFNNPVQWAGIDRILEQEIDSPTNFIGFSKAKVTMNFIDALKRGDIVTVDPHEEFISFGLNTDEIDFLPGFYDFSTNLDNGSFEVEVTLTYTDEELTELGLFESELRIWYYNEDDDVWEVVVTTIDKEANTVSFITDHFSKYAIGTLPLVPETKPLETKFRWGKYKKTEGIRSSAVSFANNTGKILNEPITLFISDIEPKAVELLEYDEQNSFGYFVTVRPEEYGRCFFEVDEDDIEFIASQSDRRRLLHDKNYNCEHMLNKYPQLEPFQVFGLQAGEYSQWVSLIFEMSPEDKRFNFKIDSLSTR